MAVSEPRFERIGVHNLIIDDSIQCRVETDLDWASELASFFLSGSDCPPIDVFEVPDGRLFVASGFQRYAGWCKALEAKPDLGDIPCNIHKGTIDDAIVFSCGSNRGNGKKPMGPKDQRKSVLMLIRTEEARLWSNVRISKYIGCGEPMVQSVRAKAAETEGIPIPSEVVRTDGLSIKKRKYGCCRPVVSFNPHSRQWRVRYKGKSFCFHRDDRAKAEALADKAEMENRERRESGVQCRSRTGVYMFFSSRGITVTAIGKHMGSLFDTSAYSYADWIFVFVANRRGNDLLGAIGRLVFHSLLDGGNRRLAVIMNCDYSSTPRSALDIFRREMGIEFLTPDEFVERVKAEESKGDSPQAESA